MNARVGKWGNSLALRIPRAFAAEAGLEDGSEVNMTVEDGEIRVRPVGTPAYRLEELLRGVTAKNLHGEVDVGSRRGGEVW